MYVHDQKVMYISSILLKIVFRGHFYIMYLSLSLSMFILKILLLLCPDEFLTWFQTQFNMSARRDIYFS